LGIERRMLEIPHEGRGVEEVDGGDAQFHSLAGIRCGIHAYSEYQLRPKDAVRAAAGNRSRFDTALQGA
jgi:hypothetical protein